MNFEQLLENIHYIILGPIILGFIAIMAYGFYMYKKHGRSSMGEMITIGVGLAFLLIGFLIFGIGAFLKSNIDDLYGRTLIFLIIVILIISVFMAILKKFEKNL